IVAIATRVARSERSRGEGPGGLTGLRPVPTGGFGWDPGGRSGGRSRPTPRSRPRGRHRPGAAAALARPHRGGGSGRPTRRPIRPLPAPPWRSRRSPRTARGRSRSAGRGRSAPAACSHPLQPELRARGVHDGRRDHGDAAVPRILAVDPLHHTAHEAGDARQPLLSIIGPGGEVPPTWSDDAQERLARVPGFVRRIGRAHAWTPVTIRTRMPAFACKKNNQLAT